MHITTNSYFLSQIHRFNLYFYLRGTGYADRLTEYLMREYTNSPRNLELSLWDHVDHVPDHLASQYHRPTMQEAVQHRVTRFPPAGGVWTPLFLRLGKCPWSFSRHKLVEAPWCFCLENPNTIAPAACRRHICISCESKKETSGVKQSQNNIERTAFLSQI